MQDIPAAAQAVADIPANFDPAPLGPRSEFIDRIRELAPTADFTDPAWGTLETPHFSIEFNMGEADLIDSFAMHVRGGDEAAESVSALLATLELRAIDPSSASGILAPRAPASESLQRSRSYRDQVLT